MLAKIDAWLLANVEFLKENPVVPKDWQLVPVFAPLAWKAQAGMPGRML